MDNGPSTERIVNAIGNPDRDFLRAQATSTVTLIPPAKALYNCAYQHRRTDVPLITSNNPVVYYADTSV